MKKIAFFSYNLEIGGAERSLVNIINFLHSKYQIDVYVYDKFGELLDCIPKDVRVFEIRKNKFMYLFFKYSEWFRKKYINKLVKDSYDYLVAYIEGRLATTVKEIDSDAMKIAWVHTDISKSNLGISSKEVLKSYNSMDKVIFVSEDAKKDFLNHYKIDDKKVMVIPNIVDFDDIKKKAKEFAVEKKKFTFINVSRMRLEKRHDLMIEACKLLKQSNCNFEMWFVGDGKQYDEISRQIEINNLNDVIKCFGLKDNPYPYLKAADCFVLASDYEGQSLVVLEALCLNKPVISTEIEVIEKLIGDNYGILCDHDAESLANAMKKMLNSQIMIEYVIAWRI